MKGLGHQHTAGKWQSQDQKPGRSKAHPYPCSPKLGGHVQNRETGLQAPACWVGGCRGWAFHSSGGEPSTVPG